MNVCGEDYYVVTFTNEFPFYYMHSEGEGDRTNFFTPSRLTNMQKYDNTKDGDGNWGLKTTSCTGAIYLVETTKSGKHYISNVVANTTDTLSFYVASDATVDFHAGGSSHDEYSTKFASFFTSGQALDGKAGGIFTATTNGTGLTGVALFDGDYHIHVNAVTRNYLNAGGVSKAGTIGTKFTKFEKSPLFADSFDHYWVDWFLGTGDGQDAQSVIATVGNRFNANLAGILGADAFAPKGMTQSDGGNVRYGYDPETNHFERSIIGGGGSTIKIKGLGNDSVMIYNTSTSAYENNASTTPQEFGDLSNWNYQVIAKVRGTSHATVETQYGEGTQTLAYNKKLLGGDKGNQYEVVITYDFKTNRLIAAWQPDEAITTPFDLESNLMLVRVEDGAPSVLNISGSGALNKITKIYTVMELTYASWTNSSEYSSRRIHYACGKYSS